MVESIIGSIYGPIPARHVVRMFGVLEEIELPIGGICLA